MCNQHILDSSTLIKWFKVCRCEDRCWETSPLECIHWLWIQLILILYVALRKFIVFKFGFEILKGFVLFLSDLSLSFLSESILPQRKVIRCSDLELKNKQIIINNHLEFSVTTVKYKYSCKQQWSARQHWLMCVQSFWAC